MNRDQLADAFDAWLRDYTGDPDAYERTEELAVKAAFERVHGEPPTYGYRCVAVIEQYVNQQEGTTV